MGRIRVLDEVLSNQIAAGEVVERPSSVVKELLENSIDAEATAITVEIDDGGVKLLRVVDDGFGMDAADARLALQRHATSKVATSSDLHHIRSLGFRGEALPSIASVSRLTLRTRQRGDLGAFQLKIEGGHEREAREAPGPVGTEIRVEDLFYNVPARRKFLKRAVTEASHVQEAVQQLALCYPQVAFRFVKDGRTAFDLPRHATLLDRARAIFGQRVADRLAPVSVDGAFGLDGLIGPPDEARATARHYHTFINGRFVRDRVVMSAVQSAYGNRLDRGRHPFVVLRIWMPPEALDVNVHPAKTEVRFVESGGVHRLVGGAISRRLADEPWAGPGEPARATGERPVDPAPTAARTYHLGDRPAPAPGAAAAGADGPGGLAGHRKRIFDAMERITAQRPALGATHIPRPGGDERRAQLDLGVGAPPPPLRLRPASGGRVQAEVFEAPRRAPWGGERDADARWSDADAHAPDDSVDDAASDDAMASDDSVAPDDSMTPDDSMAPDDIEMPSPPTPTAPEPAVVEAGADGVELAPDDLAMAHRGRVDARPRRRRPPLPTLGKRPEVAELPYDALRPLGVIGGLLICAAVDGLVGVDTTAARTWIRYDALRRGEAGQALGRPVSIELEADARARWVERAEALRALGFAVEPFGGKTHVVERVPTGVAPEAVEETLRALLDVDGDPAALAMACAEASVSDRPLLTGEGERLLDALAQIEHPLPRAVPLAFALTEDELRRKLSAP